MTTHLHTVDIACGLYGYNVCVVIEYFVGDWTVVLACMSEGHYISTSTYMYIPSAFL